MTVDWVKVGKDWDKLEARARKLSLAQAEKLMAILKARDKLLEKHEKDFRKAISTAVIAGAEGRDYKAFQGKSGVAPARKALDEDCRQLVNEINELQIYCKECDEVVRGLEKLSDLIAKGDKSKTVSPDLARCRRYVAAIQSRIRDLHEASHLQFKIDKFLLMFQKQYVAWIEHLVVEEVKGAKDEAEKVAEKDASKAGIDADSLEKAAEAMEKLRLKMDKPLTQADDVLETDLKKAAALIKTAQAELVKLKKFASEVAGLYAKNKKAIDGAKDAKERKKWLEEIDVMAKQAVADFNMIADRLKEAMKKR